jgi:PKHD-type hydroxylase
MIVRIPDLLTPDELNHICRCLDTADFVDGKLTAGWHAKSVKHNQQLARTPPSRDLTRLIQSALQRHALFQAIAFPKFIHSILFSRYHSEMSYGRHIDNALMGGETFRRSDLSFTVFLNEPDAYDGGELVIEGADSEQPYKLSAGSAIVYPSTTLHRVDPVRTGERLVAVGWVQSLIREASQHEILFDLEVVKRSLFAQDGKSDEFDLVAKSVANLLRKWAE